MSTVKGNGKYEISKKFEEISSGPEVLRMSLGIPVWLQRCLRRGKVWRDQLPGLHKRRGGFKIMSADELFLLIEYSKAEEFYEDDYELMEDIHYFDKD